MFIFAYLAFGQDSDFWFNSLPVYKLEMLYFIYHSYLY